jgi:hypothetical protein
MLGLAVMQAGRKIENDQLGSSREWLRTDGSPTVLDEPAEEVESSGRRGR